MPSPGMGYPNPAGARRLPGPPGRSYIQPGMMLPGAQAPQGAAYRPPAQRLSPDPLNNFSTR
ncbi:MAG: hypothetical protein ACYDFU_08220 [Nitrospirota bacterium]